MDNEKIVRQLELLFDFTTPKSIRESISEIFFRYLMDNHDLLPHNFETIIGDFYFLLQFIKNIEEEFAKE